MKMESLSEIFSFHLVRRPVRTLPRLLLSPVHKQNLPGLYHSESFSTMALGKSIWYLPRYSLTTVAFFARWKDEASLDSFLRQPAFGFFNEGWQIRMRLYRRWGEITELKGAPLSSTAPAPDKPVVAVTLARLNVRHTARFIRWGLPVETQVRDHRGQTMALAAIRPFNHFSTFSIWKNESEMIGMVQGKDKLYDGDRHRLAMQERVRKDFHREFSTMRFLPLREIGEWQGKTFGLGATNVASVKNG